MGCKFPRGSSYASWMRVPVGSGSASGRLQKLLRVSSRTDSRWVPNVLSDAAMLWKSRGYSWTAHWRSIWRRLGARRKRYASITLSSWHWRNSMLLSPGQSTSIGGRRGQSFSLLRVWRLPLGMSQSVVVTFIVFALHSRGELTCVWNANGPRSKKSTTVDAPATESLDIGHGEKAVRKSTAKDTHMLLEADCQISYFTITFFGVILTIGKHIKHEEQRR